MTKSKEEKRQSKQMIEVLELAEYDFKVTMFSMFKK